MKRTVMLCAVLCLSLPAFADTTEVVLGTQTTGNTIPFWGSGYAAHRFQSIFNQPDINLAGEIVKFAVMPQSISNPTYNNLRIYLCHTNRTNKLSSTFDENYDGFTPELVIDSASCTFTVGAGQWLEFPVSFDYDNVHSLLWEVRWRGGSGQNTFIWRCGTQGSDTCRVFNLGNDSAVTGSADYVRYYAKLTIVTPAGVEEVVVGRKPAEPVLAVRPNPVRQGREVLIERAATPEDAVGEVRVYDLNGRFMRALAVGHDQNTAWDLKDLRGAAVPCGVYLLRAGRRTGTVTVID